MVRNCEGLPCGFLRDRVSVSVPPKVNESMCLNFAFIVKFTFSFSFEHFIFCFNLCKLYLLVHYLNILICSLRI